MTGTTGRLNTVTWIEPKHSLVECLTWDDLQALMRQVEKGAPDLGKLFELNFERMSTDHPNTWMPCCMNSFGNGYSLREAETMKHHLESKPIYRNVQISEMLKEGGCGIDRSM